MHYPTLFKDPEQIRIRDAQCRFPGAVFAFEVAGGKAGAFDVLRRLQIARNAVSLGGVETLACHPATDHPLGDEPRGAQAGRDHRTRWCGCRWGWRTGARSVGGLPARPWTGL
jgi:cystathionine beta-lyase/cystathionine gamma-synthase